MQKSRESGFLFCNMCSTMLVLKSSKYAECPLCKTARNAQEIIGKDISYVVSDEDIRRELGISLFGEKTQEDTELPKIKKACEKCQHPELVYTTRQTRSADEGQTTYYTCPNCGHRFTEG
ncbi:hypothetical protein Bca4012_071083 [Brassica carinata]|uniref:DNA-directed RNA polymerase subunit n=3 Tax=Brassica TaxID=3705 RepID=A0A078I2Z2_BRANA|nr:PREDICTED: DNA-directed RNA polymerase I subunit RPA12-like [Brassica oleracea var. oleracea]XP_013584396.1 PREDICTED: DNA-directed RNA polymerase I subunit RPA12-like [Brassica oleracea var. oleracea]XP_013669886.1 DNA-directed RNA polymerase I subunit RPA12 [Brassica napus]XP_013669887.1 DNA-directed RNA polymerase I subunit RPA12 [Brassica napus]KAG2268814.1 hypothetical protein Bca52824_063369 [Brassica carinata]CAF1927060.1 unnamed protein product [Brassica napus]CDY44201.1 BnaC05g155